jgi:hypothetical protein
MDNDLLELSCGIGAWMSIVFLVTAYMIAEENQVQSDELAKAYLGIVIPFCVVTILYIMMQLVVHIIKLVWWLLMLMFRSDIIAISFFLLLLNLVYLTVSRTAVLLNDTTNWSPGTKDEL